MGWSAKVFKLYSLSFFFLSSFNFFKVCPSFFWYNFSKISSSLIFNLWFSVKCFLWLKIFEKSLFSCFKNFLISSTVLNFGEYIYSKEGFFLKLISVSSGFNPTFFLASSWFFFFIWFTEVNFGFFLYSIVWNSWKIFKGWFFSQWSIFFVTSFFVCIFF